jgi:hypothetical protein
MKIAPTTALAVWAVGTAWLLVYVLTHYAHHQLGYELNLMRLMQAASVVLGLVLFPAFRKWFGAWLNKSRGT